MTLEQYKQQIEQLKEKFESDTKQLTKIFALTNNPYKPGDIIEDHIGKIVIDKIKVYISLSEPQCVYYGLILTSKGLPSKLKDNTRAIYQSNIKK